MLKLAVMVLPPQSINGTHFRVNVDLARWTATHVKTVVKCSRPAMDMAAGRIWNFLYRAIEGEQDVLGQWLLGARSWAMRFARWMP